MRSGMLTTEGSQK